MALSSVWVVPMFPRDVAFDSNVAEAARCFCDYVHPVGWYGAWCHKWADMIKLVSPWILHSTDIFPWWLLGILWGGTLRLCRYPVPHQTPMYLSNRINMNSWLSVLFDGMKRRKPYLLRCSDCSWFGHREAPGSCLLCPFDWYVPIILWTLRCFWAWLDTLDSPCTFPVSNLEPAISPRTRGPH